MINYFYAHPMRFAFIALAAMLLAWLATGESVQLLGLPFALGMVADAELIVRSSADGVLAADETSGALDLGGPSDLTWRLIIPSDADVGSAETLAVVFKSCATIDGTYIEEGRFSTDETSDRTTLTLAAEGVLYKRIPLSRQFLKVTFDVTTGTDYGLVDLRAVSAGEYNTVRRAL